MSSRRLREFARSVSPSLLQGFMALIERVGFAKLLQSDPFVNEQPALPADAAAVSGKTSISADDSMARNHNGNRVCRIGQGDRTDRFRAAQLPRQRPITERRTGLDRSECRPNLALKRGASRCDRDRIDRAEIAQEVVADRPPNCLRCGAVLYSEVISFRAIMEPKKTPHARLEVVKVQSAHMPFAVMDEKQCSERALEAIGVQGLRRYCACHRIFLKARACVRPHRSSVHGQKMPGRIGSPRPPRSLPAGHDHAERSTR